jgi:alpha-tubulin suppressor-like RCC1 family protein
MTMGLSNAPGITPQHYAVAATVARMYFIKPDHTVVYIERANPDAIITTAYTDIVSIAAGDSHILFLHKTGVVTAEFVGPWNDKYGQEIVPVGLADVVAISCGCWMSYALKSDGTAVAWGRNDQGQTTIADDNQNIIGIYGGRHHALLLTLAGTVLHIGSGANNDDDTYPVQDTAIRRLQSNDIRAIAITDDNKMIDLFDKNIHVISTDVSIVDVAASWLWYGLLYNNGQLVLLNRYTQQIEYTIQGEDDPFYSDPIVLQGIRALVVQSDILFCITFDGRVYALRDENLAYDLAHIAIPDTLRCGEWSQLTQAPAGWDADACHHANLQEIDLAVQKQNNPRLRTRVKRSF